MSDSLWISRSLLTTVAVSQWRDVKMCTVDKNTRFRGSSDEDKYMGESRLRLNSRCLEPSMCR